MILQIRARPPLALLAVALLALLWAGLVAGPARAAGDDEVDLFDLSLEELAQVQVTTVTGAPQDWFGTPAAIPEGFGGYRQVGTALFTDYVLAFEATSLILLAAMVGAVILAKRKID